MATLFITHESEYTIFEGLEEELADIAEREYWVETEEWEEESEYESEFESDME